MSDKILTVLQAAQKLGISTTKLYLMCQKGQIPFTKVGASYRFITSKLDEWLENGGNKEEDRK